MKVINIIALVLVIIGALNWGLLGFFGLDLVHLIFGDMTIASRVIYGLVGIAGLVALGFFGMVGGAARTGKV